MADEPLIDIQDLSIGFRSRSGAMLSVLRNVDLQIKRGETLGIVGESGSGKSTIALAAMGYLKRGLQKLGGSVRFDGQDMFAATKPQLQALRGGRLALIPQNSGQSLTPTLRIGRQIGEALALHSRLAPAEHPARIVELLRQVRLPDPEQMAARYPHELSGGQQQRAAVAMALAGEPEALLLDEPTTGLDVTTQAHILDLLRDITAQSGTAMVYVSHDLGAIARVCDRVAVMYAGEVVLTGETREVLRRPAHPYARGLLGSIPRMDDGLLPEALEGRPPPPGGAGDSCAFAPRCSLASDVCRTRRPQLTSWQDGLSRCHHLPQVAGLPERSRGRRATSASASAVALSLENLAISYARPTLIEQLLGRRPSATPTVSDITLSIARGETIGLVGESGSGKSTILKSVAGLLGRARGSIRLEGAGELASAVEQRPPDQLRQIQLIFQNPDESLNPRHTVEEILAQPLKLYFGLSGDELRARIVALLEQVRLGAHYLDRLPGQLSGGEKQRVAVARAFAAEPAIVLCDEVTSALDVSVQAAVLDLLDRLKSERGTTYAFVSHDLAVVRALSDRVAVLYQGRLCEIGPAAEVYALPSHPYTEMLLGAALEPDPDHRPKLLADDVTESSPPARGCPFQRRCHRKIGPVCETEAPTWRVTGSGHAIRCHIPREELLSAQKESASARAA
jgi:peptide/nickel transport system ATP-binding protein